MGRDLRLLCRFRGFAEVQGFHVIRFRVLGFRVSGFEYLLFLRVCGFQGPRCWDPGSGGLKSRVSRYVMVLDWGSGSVALSM